MGPDSSGQETKFTSTQWHKQQVCDLGDDRQLSLLTGAPRFCPKCMTGFRCEDEPCTASYESTCKSCVMSETRTKI